MYILMVMLLVIVCVGLIGVVLLQSGRGDGLSGAFGMGEGQAVFGSRAGDVLTKATSWFAIGFMVLCIAVAWLSKHAGASVLTGRRGRARPPRGRVAPLMSLEETEKREKNNAAKATNAVGPATTAPVAVPRPAAPATTN
ncbi:MAG: preprotein translocase subunit SecG [bacterium]|nr:preprotein translocase subunit SecG [bacterium]